MNLIHVSMKLEYLSVAYDINTGMADLIKDNGHYTFIYSYIS